MSTERIDFLLLNLNPLVLTRYVIPRSLLRDLRTKHPVIPAHSEKVTVSPSALEEIRAGIGVAPESVFPAAKSSVVGRILRELGTPPTDQEELTFANHRYETLTDDWYRDRGLVRRKVTVPDSVPLREGIILCCPEWSNLRIELVAPSPTMSAEATQLFLELYGNVLGNCRTVICSGSIACGIVPGTMHRLISMATDMGKRFMLDSADYEYQQRCCPYLLKVNAEEASRIFGRSLLVVDDAIPLVRSVLGPTAVMITFGEQGAILGTGGAAYHVNLPPSKMGLVVNPVGAGDTVMAVMAYYMERCLDVVEACKRAIYHGARNAEVWDEGGVSCDCASDVSLSEGVTCVPV